MEKGLLHKFSTAAQPAAVFRSAALALFFVFLMTALLPSKADAQDTYTYDFRGTSLSEALEAIASDTGTDLIFDPKITSDRYIYKRLRGNTIQELLQGLLEEEKLDFIILSSGTFMIVASPASHPSFGSFSGAVTDAQTGEPLPGATVMYANAAAGTVTNRSGQFNLSRMLIGEHDLIISYIGYEPVKLTVQVKPDENSRKKIELQPRPVDVSPIVVSAHRRTMQTYEHRDSYNSQGQLYETAGSHCPIRSLSMFSGVQHGLPLTDIRIQGAQRGDHRLYLDGVPVYNPYSFGNLFSAFSPYAISRVEVEKAGFDASAGSHISGMINMKHASGSPQDIQATVQADPLSTNVFGSGGISTDSGRQFDLMAAYRTSVWDIHQDRTLSGTLQDWETVDPLLYNLLINEKNGTGAANFRSANNSSDIRFSDLHLSASYRHNPYNRFHASVYTGSNTVRTDVLAREQLHEGRTYMFSRDAYEWDNFAGQISYDWIATPRLDIGVQTAYSSNNMGHAYSMLDDDIISLFVNGDDTVNEGKLFDELGNQLAHGATQMEDNSLSHFFTRADATYAFSPRFSLHGGLQADRVVSRFNLNDLFYLPVIDTQRSTILSSHINGSWVISGPVTIKAGSRFTYLDGSGRVYAEPRARIQYDRQESAIGFWSLRLAGGIYRQFINQFDITNAGPSSVVPSFTVWAHDSSLRQPKAYHGSLSFLSEPGPSTMVRLEGWARIQPETYITSYERLLLGDPDISQGFDAFAEITDMQSLGAGIRVEQAMLNSRLNVLAGYDYTYSSVNMQSQFGRRVAAPWSQPHTILARVTGRITQNWIVAGNWQRITGRTWGFRQSYYDFLMMHNVHSVDRFDFTSPENDRLPAFDQLDFSVIFERSLGFTSVQARLDLLNVLNRRNVIDKSVQVTSIDENGNLEFDVRNRRLPGFNPRMSIQLTF